MKKNKTPKHFAGRGMVIIGLISSILLLSGCPAAPDDGTGDGTSGFTDEEATEIILFVYDTLNRYALKGEGEYYRVSVSETYNSDNVSGEFSFSAYVEFSDYSEDGNTIGGSGTVQAYEDVRDGLKQNEYGGSLTGMYEGRPYSLVINYAIQLDNGSYDYAGSFRLNGNAYIIETGTEMMYDYFIL